MALLNSLLKKNVKATYKPNPLKNYVEKTLADTTKAEKILKFRAKYSFEEWLNHHVCRDQ